MKRLGFCTGRLYPGDFPPENIFECCHVLSDSDAEDTEKVSKLRWDDGLTCPFCLGCPEAHEKYGVNKGEKK